MFNDGAVSDNSKLKSIVTCLAKQKIPSFSSEIFENIIKN